MRTVLCLILSLVFYFYVSAQDLPVSHFTIEGNSPLILRNSVLMGPQQIGWQTGVGKLVSQNIKQINRRSGKKKMFFKDRIVWSTLGYYYHKDLHSNLYLTIDYSFLKKYKRGYYRDFTTIAGISRTFINSTVYTVDDNGKVDQKKMAGDWRLATGLSYGYGKNFDKNQFHSLKNIYLKVNCMILYPNFRFIALKPSVMIGLDFNLLSKKYPYHHQNTIIKR